MYQPPTEKKDFHTSLSSRDGEAPRFDRRLRVDKSIRLFLERLNSEGFKTTGSCSGLQEDHVPWHKTDTGGNLCFEIRNPREKHRIINAFQKANWWVDDSESDKMKKWICGYTKKHNWGGFMPKGTVQTDADIKKMWQDLEKAFLEITYKPDST